MNIQPINQNRQQNFGINFKVVAPEAEKAVVEGIAKRVLGEINHYISPELRGKLTLAMQDAGGDATVYLHPAGEKYSDIFILSKENIAPTNATALIASPVDSKKTITHMGITLEACAEGDGNTLLDLIRSFDRPIPESVKTEEALAAQMKVIG